MAINNVTLSTKFLQWKDITNDIITSVGDTDLLTTTATDLTSGINELDALQGNDSFVGLTSTTLTGAVNELRAELGDITALTSPVTTDSVLAINSVDDLLDNVISGTQDITYDNATSGLTSITVQDAIDEVSDSANIAYDNVASGLTATTIQDAIDEVEGRVDTLEIDTHSHANLTNLDTIDQNLATTDTVSFNFVLESVTTGITAFDTGGQTNATALTTSINEISTVGTAGDSVKLPTASAGLKIYIINNGANACDVFPDVSDDLGVGVDTAISLLAGETVTYIAYDDTNWRAF